MGSNLVSRLLILLVVFTISFNGICSYTLKRSEASCEEKQAAHIWSRPRIGLFPTKNSQQTRSLIDTEVNALTVEVLALEML